MAEGKVYTHTLIPGILEKDWDEIEKKIKRAKKFAQVLHIDSIDGKFASNTTFLDPRPFRKYSQDLFLEVHLMVDNPLSYLQPFAEAGFKRFIGHIEKMHDQVEFVATGQLLGEVGLAVDGKTPLENVKVPYEDLDLITIMTIDAGFSGKKFAKEHLEKVKKIRATSDILIEVDGGVNDTAAYLAKDAGANFFVSNSYLFGSSDPKKTYEDLNRALQQ